LIKIRHENGDNTTLMIFRGSVRNSSKFCTQMTYQKLNQENKYHFKKSVTSSEIETVIKNIPTKKSLELNKFTIEFYQTFKELMPLFFKLFHKIEREEVLPKSFYETNIAEIQKLDKGLTKNRIL
jgi:hypothetical protein